LNAAAVVVGEVLQLRSKGVALGFGQVLAFAFGDECEKENRNVVASEVVDGSIAARFPTARSRTTDLPCATRPSHELAGQRIAAKPRRDVQDLILGQPGVGGIRFEGRSLKNRVHISLYGYTV
jgi:hypothetical protein